MSHEERGEATKVESEEPEGDESESLDGSKEALAGDIGKRSPVLGGEIVAAK
jgi:hypothetical protein